jgi:hypothetical protein
LYKSALSIPELELQESLVVTWGSGIAGKRTIEKLAVELLG